MDYTQQLQLWKQRNVACRLHDWARLEDLIRAIFVIASADHREWCKCHKINDPLVHHAHYTHATSAKAMHVFKILCTAWIQFHGTYCTVCKIMQQKTHTIDVSFSKRMRLLQNQQEIMRLEFRCGKIILACKIDHTCVYRWTEIVNKVHACTHDQEGLLYKHRLKKQQHIPLTPLLSASLAASTHAWVAVHVFDMTLH